MRYVSTRGQSPPVSFAEAALGGVAPDGGLYVPETWPSLAPLLTPAAAQPYAVTASAVLGLFAGDELTLEERRRISTQAYGGGRFDSPAVAPLHQLDGGRWLLDLMHGPSLAFKDVALQLLGQLYEHLLARTGRRITVVCATSGDTGGAAVEALRGSERADLFVLTPKNRISEVQRRFITTSGAANVHVLEVDADFDLCQGLVKALFTDADFASRAALSAVNSVNWARILAQSVYFVRAAAALSSQGPIDFVVPTGNFGDAYSAYAAKLMGAPIQRIGLAVNANDILVRALREGRYERAPHSIATSSPAMDIQVASNFERLVFEASGRDAALTRASFETLSRTGGFDIPQAALEHMRASFVAMSASEPVTMQALSRHYMQHRQMICPHTAVGFGAFRGDATWSMHTPCVYLATAHPAKFPETVERATGVRPQLPAKCATLFAREERIDSIPATAEALKNFISERSRAWT
ncbi:MAG: threonine synthase [Hyphomonadaceae bacterium]